jgi:hypothetical protein
VEELCGLAGVIPSSLDVKTWHGSVIFEEKSVSVIPYADASTAVQPSREDVMVKNQTSFRISVLQQQRFNRMDSVATPSLRLSVCKIVWY